ncbi:MAG: site-2 protease family protein [Chloroflexota bacterium]|nr:site-2 protease family protein [Chloroflexota bacterium]
MLGIDLNPERIIIYIVTFLVAITVHEFMHAWTAAQLGDQTARNLGRVSFNPAVHFDPIGFFLFLLIALGFPAIAWGKPVPVNTYNLRPLGRFGKKGSMALIALAGPVSNVVLAAIAAIPLRLGSTALLADPVITNFLFIFVSLNLLLAAFNMIPIPPLDGSKILMGLLPNFWTPVLAPLERYGFMVLLLIILIGGLGRELLNGMIAPVYDLLQTVVLPF